MVTNLWNKKSGESINLRYNNSCEDMREHIQS